MARVRQKNTAPELVVRRVLHRLGYRFRLHRRALPGTPDIVLPKFRLAIFVHGCFWHRHPGCVRSTTPKSRIAYWMAKFEANVARDAEKEQRLRELGWQVFVVWECETFDTDQLARRLTSLLAFGSDTSQNNDGARMSPAS